MRILFVIIMLSWASQALALRIREPIICVASSDAQLPFPPISERLAIDVTVGNNNQIDLGTAEVDAFFANLNLSTQDLYPMDCIAGYLTSVEGKIKTACQTLRRRNPGLNCDIESVRRSLDVVARGIAQRSQVYRRIQEDPNGLTFATVFPMETLTRELRGSYQGTMDRMYWRFRRTCDLNYYDGADDRNSLVMTKKFMEERIFPFINSRAGEKCRGPVIDFYSQQLLQLQASCEGNAQRAQCVRFRASSIDTVEWLTRLRAIDYNPQYFTCMMARTENPFELLQTTIHEVADQISCQPTRVGGSRIVKDHIDRLGYKLKRKTNDEFEIHMNLKFEPASRNTEMQALVRRCFMQVNELTNGNVAGTPALPHGTKTSFVLNTTEQDVPEGIVSVEGGVSDEATTWPPDIDCPTMIRRLYNHLGLPDSYAGTGGQSQNPFPCRVEGAPTSIMNNQYQAFNRVQENGGHLLSADQMRVVLYPGCRSGAAGINNSRFYQCARHADMDLFQCFATPVEPHCRTRNVGL